MKTEEEITQVTRIRNERLINEQPVAEEIVRLASEEEGVDTAVVSFFDVDYVRSDDDYNAHSERARDRLDKRLKVKRGFIRK